MFNILKKAATESYEEGGCAMACLVVLFAAAVIFASVCFGGWIFMLLWNWLAVELFGAQVLGYWLCVGIVFALNFLGRLIFGRQSSSDDN